MIKLKKYWERLELSDDQTRMDFLADAFILFQHDPKHYLGFYGGMLLTCFFLLILGMPFLFGCGIVLTLLHAVIYMYRFLSLIKSFRQKWG